MSEHKEQIAKQLMEAFFYARRREHRMYSREGKRKPGEIMVLYAIRSRTEKGEPGIMVSEISEKLDVTSPTVTQHINSLEAQGYVERQADAADRRIVRIRLTEEGEKYIQAVNDARLRMFLELVEHLGEEQSVQFAESLQKASDYMFKEFMKRHSSSPHEEGES
ncbi:MarR family transcriptional regulator [Xylanibacillus composti]|uniref:Transcriptional regulator n=1 Tax=Xylanibacillus composti TaxID=1572762 RepID=A0A8J4M2L2_9BACL|nr:MarR family transcriptional regulator [Xylanibacillus composti]MDT9726889.1 MarR family transcriptional regulator [Xylanibacillus composti]GIQ69799.1 transcriptional regulator [Xylanibacillus composti]